MIGPAEARTKWCPFARTPYRSDAALAAVNRRGAEPVECYCIADKCMAWRTRSGTSSDPYEPGWCGLAGEPK